MRFAAAIAIPPLQPSLFNGDFFERDTVPNSSITPTLPSVTGAKTRRAGRQNLVHPTVDPVVETIGATATTNG
jgi:hypothetical protein